MTQRTTLLTVVMLFCCASGRSWGQAGDGYVGVFGDALGTIRCMQAPPYVPTTLYVLAKTSGATASGITGAEFRIEFTNPTGYFLTYAAPESCTTFGDPLNSTGLNVAFPSCRVPSDSIIPLGIIQVFNAGSGGQTDIIIKRRNPPTNANYPCALLVQCDAPTYTKSCTTAPPDSVSCLLQKVSPRISSSDEFTTHLDGTSQTVVFHHYVGYKLDSTSGFTAAFSVIATAKPSVAPGGAITTWVGIDNRVVKDMSKLHWRWIQTGWVTQVSGGNPNQFLEYTGPGGYDEENPGTDGHVFQTLGQAPLAPEEILYGLEKNGIQVEVTAGTDFRVLPATFDDYNSPIKLLAAQFGAELQTPQGQSGNTCPGTVSQPCHFWSAVVAEGGGVFDAPLNCVVCSKRGQNCHFPNGTEALVVGGNNGTEFNIWDITTP